MFDQTFVLAKLDLTVGLRLSRRDLADFFADCQGLSHPMGPRWTLLSS